jgi:predicted pyridoxine 5'-phosphate oxidase superfamily flavin-nucleotide-binding protein
MAGAETGQEQSPWHAGERAVQREAGVAGLMERAGRRNIRSFLPDQHRAFFATLPFVVVGAVDAAARPWATIIAGRPGFLTTPTPRSLRIAGRPPAGDLVGPAIAVGVPLGLLGIDLATRRRNRANGRVVAVDDAGFSVAVEQSFGNCPQYIQRRDYGGRLDNAPLRAEPIGGLDAAARALIRGSDTCFVASAAPAGIDQRGSIDVSHRGGMPGFIAIGDDGVLTVPDYRGNRYFNTLGNLAVNPRAGLLFVDFSSGELLQLTGTTELVWSGPELRALPGAERLWRFAPISGNWLRGGFPLRLEFRDFSPTSLAAAGASERRPL